MRICVIGGGGGETSESRISHRHRQVSCMKRERVTHFGPGIRSDLKRQMIEILNYI